MARGSAGGSGDAFSAVACPPALPPRADGVCRASRSEAAGPAGPTILGVDPEQEYFSDYGRGMIAPILAKQASWRGRVQLSARARAHALEVSGRAVEPFNELLIQ